MNEPLVVRPRRLVAVCWFAAALVVVVFGVLALLLPTGEVSAPGASVNPTTGGSGGTFGPADQISFFVLGLLIAAVPVAFTRVRVVADERGVHVRNGLGERFLPWGVVVGVHLPESASWAQLELRDDETVALLAVQSNDGEHAVEAVLALRRVMASAQRA